MHPTGYHDQKGRLLFAARRYEEGIDELRQLANPKPKCLAFLAGCLARLDRLDEAEEVVERLRELDSELTAEVHSKTIPYRYTADRQQPPEVIAARRALTERSHHTRSLVGIAAETLHWKIHRRMAPSGRSGSAGRTVWQVRPLRSSGGPWDEELGLIEPSLGDVKIKFFGGWKRCIMR